MDALHWILLFVILVLGLGFIAMSALHKESIAGWDRALEIAREYEAFHPALLLYTCREAYALLCDPDAEANEADRVTSVLFEAIAAATPRPPDPDEIIPF